MPAPLNPDPRDMFKTVRGWTDEVFPDSINVEILVHFHGGKATRIRVPKCNQPAAATPKVVVFRHDATYRDVFWHGHRFKFSKTQAAVVELLHLAKKDGHPDVDQGVIIQQIGSEAGRLIELFRRGDGARAWGLLIVQGDTPGSYRLADRPPEPTEDE